jgi:hypothetical protein
MYATFYSALSFSQVPSYLWVERVKCDHVEIYVQYTADGDHSAGSRMVSGFGAIMAIREMLSSKAVSMSTFVLSSEKNERALRNNNSEDNLHVIC